jgi:epoxyqueuosine reductase
VYARGKDYHDLVKKRLKRIGRWLVETNPCEIRVFVDTAPVMEKPLAQKAGIGWQGKHTNLVSPDFGSWLFLGEIYISLEISPDAPTPDHCGSCTRCLDACPTKALSAPYQIDARRCISYLTIEQKEPIDEGLAVAMGNHIYGCDNCLDVCPWNKFSSPTRESSFFPRIELTVPRLAELSKLDDAEFRQLFSGSPIKRTGRDRFVRNVLIAIGNSGKKELAPAAQAKLDDSSPLVASAAQWALSRLEKGA